MKTKGVAGQGAGGAFIALALVILLGAGGAFWWETTAARNAPSASGQASIGGPFQMLDQDGRPVDQRVLNGHWSAVFFGYTFCPDTCPATLQALGHTAQRLGGRAKDFQVVFVSVDPGRDHPSEMKAYVAAQDLPVRTLGLSGSPAQVAAIAKAYRASYAKEGKGPNYAMQHTAVIYLMDPKGQFAAPLSPQMTPEQMAAEIIKAQG